MHAAHSTGHGCMRQLHTPPAHVQCQHPSHTLDVAAAMLGPCCWPSAQSACWPMASSPAAQTELAAQASSSRCADAPAAAAAVAASAVLKQGVASSRPESGALPRGLSSRRSDVLGADLQPWQQRQRGRCVSKRARCMQAHQCMALPGMHVGGASTTHQGVVACACPALAASAMSEAMTVPSGD